MSGMTTMNLEQARFNMIEQQIRTWEVLDKQILELLERIPRDHFVPEAYKNLAYADIEIPLEHGEYMLAPKIEAKIMQALLPKPKELALEIGTGYGYLTALLASSVSHVYSVDLYEDFRDTARANLTKMGITNMTIDVGDASKGWPEHGPFDVIAITATVPELDSSWQQMLTVGGRLFAFIGDASLATAVLITRTAPAEFSTETLFETAVQPMRNLIKKQEFLL